VANQGRGVEDDFQKFSQEHRARARNVSNCAAFEPISSSVKQELISRARLATLEELRQTIISVYLSPVPTKDTLRAWFDAAQIPRLKANPTARRGGGPVYYSVAAVEKFLRSRALPGRLAAEHGVAAR
jgi:hypothetical protein